MTPLRRRPGRRLDPTHPDAWPRVRAMGKTAVLVRFGILGVGVPVALALNAALVAMRGDSGLIVSEANAFELTFTLLLVAPLLGAIAGHAIWARGERRSGRFDTWSVEDQPEAPPTVTHGDAEQRRLSALEASLNDLALRSPRRLTLRALAFTVLGYGYVVSVFGIIVLAIRWLRSAQGEFSGIAGITSQLLIWLAFFVASALWVRLLEPGGRRLSRASSPALFETLEEIGRKIDAPIPDVVLLSDQLNAMVSEIPRYGIFGLPKRYLVIGLPLLEALSADECRAILAHELAHLSRRHLRRLTWTVRLSVTWQTLATSLAAGRHWGRGLFLPFFRWYAPRFELLARAVSRHDEYESDALSAECVGADVAVRALLRLHVTERFLEESILRRERRESLVSAEPPAGAFERMAAALRAGAPRADLERWLRAALRAQTLHDHTHPSLGDRIRKLDASFQDGEGRVTEEASRLSAAAGPNGADTLLGVVRVAKLRPLIEKSWQGEQAVLWRRLHADARVWQPVADAPDGGTNEQAWARARWATLCEPREMALPRVRDVLRREPGNLEAAVCLGQLLSESDDPREHAEGMHVLEEALHRDGALARLAGAVLKDRYSREGDQKSLERVRTRERQIDEQLIQGRHERMQLRASDRLAPYALPEPMLAALREAAAAQPRVTSVHLVRKRTQFLRAQPSVMLAVQCEIPWYLPSTGHIAREASQALLDRISLPETADLLVVPVEPRTALSRRLRDMPAALVYRREPSPPSGKQREFGSDG